MKQLFNSAIQSLKNLNRLQKWFIALFLLTVVMVIFISLFQRNSPVHHPQHEYFEKVDEMLNLSEKGISSYYGFFFTDFVWAFALLYTLFLVLKSIESYFSLFNSPVHKNQVRAGIKIFTWTAILAYSFDAIENTHYMKLWDWGFFGAIVSLKKLFYGLSFLVVLIFLYKRHVHFRLKQILQVVGSSFFSLVILGIIVFLITQVAQGPVIVVALLKSPGNMFISLLLITILAQVTSHYPTYFLEIFYKRPTIYTKWRLVHKVLGIGVIYYDKENVSGATYEESKDFDRTESRMRIWHHLIGVLSYLAFIFILLKVGVSQKLIQGWVQGLILLLALLMIPIYFYAYENLRRKASWLWVAFLVLLSIVLAVAGYGWNSSKLILFTLSILTGLIAYTYFRIKRNELGVESDIYVIVMRYVILAVFIGLLLINLIPGLMEWINPINVVLLYLIYFYALVIRYFKHVYYYSGEAITAQPIYKFTFYKYLLPVSGILFIGLLLNSGQISNKLHQLRDAEFSGSEIDAKSYISSLQKADYNYYLGAYGGGIRANTWTLLVVDELEKQSDRKFLRHTAGLSGVSGGMIGLGNYTSLYKNFTPDQIPNKIDEISKFNFLSIDLTMTLGHDLVLEFVPNHSFRDRGDRAMKNYAGMANAHDGYMEKSYQEYWSGIYKEDFYPALFVNTTSTNGHQGVAVPFPLEAPVVPGRHYFLDVPGSGRQLTFYATLSTANRFPVLSPAANVDKIGHFVDGGYYENSGLLTLNHFYEGLKAVADKDSVPLSPPHYVNLLNGREEYVEFWLEDIPDEYKQIKDESLSGEVGAIFSTLLSLDKFPHYIRAKLKDQKTDIPLPYPLTYAEVIKSIGGEVEHPEYLLAKIQEHNDRLYAHLKSHALYASCNGVVLPSLARLQTDEVITYQKIMLEFGPVKKQIEKVLEVNGL